MATWTTKGEITTAALRRGVTARCQVGEVVMRLSHDRMFDAYRVTSTLGGRVIRNRMYGTVAEAREAVNHVRGA